MALGFSPLDTKVEGGEIMSDFEIISVVIMVISHGAASQIFDLSRQRFSQSENSETSGFRPFVLKAIKFGRDDNNKKKKK